MGEKAKPDPLPSPSSSAVLSNVCSLHPPQNCPAKTLMSCQLNVFDLLQQVGQCIVAFAVGFGRGVGSIPVNGVSFFFCRFREWEVRDGEMSPLSFQANLMIILKGNFFVLIFCLFKHIIFLLYILCNIIVKGNFSILIIYSVFANSPPLCKREEFNITLFITLFKLRTKQCTPVGLLQRHIPLPWAC